VSGDKGATKVLVTSSILDALSVLGALENTEERCLVVAPGNAKGSVRATARALPLTANM